MSTCPACGAENAPDARFCTACGGGLVLECPTCGHDVPAGSRFCPACGGAVEGPSTLAGEERKIVTVLFADLVDSTAHAERLDPEDLRGILSPYFAALRAEVERRGGTVEKFIGDAVMALFGAPVAHEDDPHRAVLAAVAIRDAVAELNKRTPQADLHVRVGVNTGEAVVALGASADTGEGMAAGDVLSTCFRLQTAAPVDGILVGEGTYQATADTIDYAEMEPVVAKGKAERVPAWQVVAPRALEDEAPRTPLVGRTQELDLLQSALARVRSAGTPQFVSLVGVPGIGKTRLVFELLGAIEAADGTVCLRGRSLPYGEGASFAALAEMAKSQAGILRTDPSGVAADKLGTMLGELLAEPQEAEWVGEHLRTLVGLAGDLPRGDRRSESFAAWRRFFEALGETAPLVLVFEDLHWADEGLLDFVDHLVDWAGSTPMLVVCTARPELVERRPGWGGGKPNSTTISLQPLEDEEIGELVGALVEGALPEEVETSLLSHAGGNPLYAEEYARMLVDRELLDLPGGAQRLPLPSSVQGIIAARIDALAPEEKTILHAAAVVGKAAWVGAVAAITEAPRENVETRLHALERKEFVRRERRSSVAAETEYSFRHVLLRDVAYGQIPRARRSEAHHAAAQWFDDLAADREDQAELLAHHYVSALELAQASGLETAELSEHARHALRAAADRAVRLNSFAAATGFYQAALELWPEDDEQAQVRFGLGKALFHQGLGTEVLEAARDELLGTDSKDAAAEAESLLGILADRQGQAALAVEHARKAVALLDGVTPTRVKAQVLARLAGLLMTSHPPEAVGLGRSALVMAESLGADDLRAHALTTIGFARAMSGDFEGAGDVEAAIALSGAGNLPDYIRAHAVLSALLAHEGDLRRSAELRAEASHAAERYGDLSILRFLEAERVAESYWSGDWDEAASIADDFIGEGKAGRRHYGEILCREMRAQIRLAQGNVEGAVEDAAQGLVAARETGHAQSLYPALAIAARAHLAAESPTQAEERVDELLATWSSERRMPPSYWIADLAVTMDGLGRGDELVARANEGDSSTRWLDAAVAYVRDPRAAAEVYARIGSRPDEAFARLRAAEALLAAGDRGGADAELAPAIEFYRAVGADAHVRRGEELAAAV
ncbi:MAG: AAA family ATPase [Actinomycetota bacterium]|nr:AAA family ATPase [Actinomycetota bacterium]